MMDLVLWVGNFNFNSAFAMSSMMASRMFVLFGSLGKGIGVRVLYVYCRLVIVLFGVMVSVV